MKMIRRFIAVLLSIVSTCAFASCTLVSWNLENLGAKKSDVAITGIANVLVRAKADVVAVQEVTAGKGAGVNAIAKITDEMNRMRSNSYDYIVSDPTEPATPGVERYAFIWKKSSMMVNRRTTTLLASVREAIDREPYVLHAESRCAAPFVLMSFHAEPDEKSKGKDPRPEVRVLAADSGVRSFARAIIAGDFNVRGADVDDYFSGAGYRDAIDVPTSLGVKVGKRGYLRNNFDHFFVKGIDVKHVQVIDFVSEMGAGNVDDKTLKRAREMSDHLPILMTFD